MAGLTDKKIERLQKSIKWSIRQLEFPRRKRIEAIYQYCGSHYAQGGESRRVPVNHLKMAVDIYVRTLAPQAPRSMFSTRVEGLKSTAINMEYAINDIPDEIGLTGTLRRFVTEALFSMGILKCGLHSVGNHLGHPYGTQFVDNVTMDDYFIDMSAKRMEQIQYEGNDYWADYEDIMDADWVDKEVRGGLKPTENTVIGANGEERAEGMATQETAEVFRDRIWLRDVWLPAEKILVTHTVEGGGGGGVGKVLNVIDWDGPRTGPYPKLGFADVPGNLLPLAPVQIWRDLHELGNALFRKLANQGDSEKTVLGFPGGNEDSVEDFAKASDGDGIVYKGAKPEMLTAGGIKEKTLAFYLQTRDLQSYFAGNLDALGGLSAMSETVGQDKLMSEAASAQLRDMSARTVETVTDVMYALAYYEWHDPIKKRTLNKKIPGTGLTVPTEFGPGDKHGEFNLYDLKIDVYSLQDNSPALKLQKLGAIVDRYILPLAPLIDAAGGTIDVQQLLAIVAKYSDMPEVGEIVKFMEPQPGTQALSQAPPKSGAGPSGPSGPGGMTREGASAVMQQQLLGKGMQAGEAAQTGG